MIKCTNKFEYGQCYLDRINPDQNYLFSLNQLKSTFLAFAQFYKKAVGLLLRLIIILRK